MADTSWMTQLQQAVPTGANARFYAQQKARISALNAIDPTLAQIPGGLIGASSLNVDDGNFYQQVSAYQGARAAQLTRSQFETYAPGMQRVLWSKMDTTQQQALQASGYQPPQAPEPQSGGLLDSVGNAIGSFMETPTKVIGGAISPLLEPLGELGQIPADAYRAIRTQPEWVQALAAAGAAAAGVAAVVATGGTALPFLAGASPILAGSGTALAGGFATAGIVNSLQGNPEFWGKAFQWGDAGETTWSDGVIAKARDMIGSDGNLLELAKTLGYTDPWDLTRDTAGIQGAHDLSQDQKLKKAEELSLKAGPFQSQEQQTAFQNLLKIMDDPNFNQAVGYLRANKISPGRDLAHLLGLNEGDWGYGTLSGLADAGFQIVTDPTLIAGRALKLTRAARYGMGAMQLGEAGTWADRVASVGERPQVQRAWGVIADGMESGDYKTLNRTLKGTQELQGPMLDWQRQFYPGRSWDKDMVKEFFQSADGAQAIARGGAVSSRHGLLEMPHLNPMQEWVGNTRAQLGGIIDFLDDDNISFKLHVPNGAAAPEYSTYQHLNTASKLIVNVVSGVPILKQVGEAGATLAKTLTTMVPQRGFLTLTEGALDVDQAREMSALADIWRAVGIPSNIRNDLTNKLIGAGSAAQRRSLLESFYRQSFDQAGLWSTAEGKELGESFINHAHQALIGGTDKAVFENMGARAIAIPDIRELRLATARQAVLNKVLNAADAKWITSAVSTVWKPAVLLRVGFIPRIIGDELLSFVARMGVKGYLAGQLGLVAARADDELLAHARGLEHLGRIVNRGLDIGSFGLIAKDDTDRLLHSWLLQYSQGIRGYARSGVLSPGMRDTALGRYLSKENTFRGLVFGGMGQDGAYALDFVRDPRTQTAIMSHISSRQGANVIGDPTFRDGMRMYQRRLPDGTIEKLMAINPKNERVRVDGLTGEGMHAHLVNQWDMLSNRSVQNAVQASINMPSPTVMDHLDDMPGFVDNLNQVTRNLDDAERTAVAIMATDNANSVQALKQYGDFFANQGDLRLKRVMEKVTTREQAVRELPKMGARVRSAMDVVRPNLDMDGNFKSWMGIAIHHPGDVAPTRAGSEAAHRSVLREANRDWFDSPEFQGREWTHLDLSKKTMDGTPVAYPQDHSLPHFYMPYGDNINPVLDELQQLPNLDQDVIKQAFRQNGIALDDETSEAIYRMANNRRVGQERQWNMDGPYAVSMLHPDADLTRKVSTAFARLNKEDVGTIVEVPSHRNLLGGMRANHNVPWASNPVDYTAEGKAGYFVDGEALDRNFITYGPDVPITDGIPGIPTPQAIDDFRDHNTTGIYDLYFGPRSGFPDPGDVTVKGAGTDKIAETPHDAFPIKVEELPEGRSSAPVRVEDGTITVDPKRANLDILAGSPYLHGKAQVKREAIEVPTHVGPASSFPEEDLLPGEDWLVNVNDIPVKNVKNSTFQARATTDDYGKPVIQIDEKNITSRYQQYVEAHQQGIVPPEWYRTARSQHTSFDDFMNQFDNEAEYRQFVIEHERGHMANNHAWTDRPMEGEQANAAWVQREHDADQVAYQTMGKAPIKRDPRSVRLNRALTEAGVDPDTLVNYISSQGESFYPNFLAELEANRLRYGDTLEGDLAAVEAVVSKYDIPFTGTGTIRTDTPGIEPRMNWGSFGPRYLEDQLPGDVKLAHASDAARIYEHDRARVAVQELKYVAQTKGKLGRAVEWGFNKVGVAQDVLLRNPMAMATYVKARRDWEVIAKELLDPEHFAPNTGSIWRRAEEILGSDTRRHVSTLTRAEQKKLVRAGRILELDYSPRAMGVANRIGGDEAAVQALRDQGHADLADLVANVRGNGTVDQTVKDLMRRADNGDFSWANGIEAQARNAHKNWTVVQQQAHDGAVVRTLRDMTPFIDDHRVRSQFQQYVNNVIPFWYAEDQFMRRWARTFVYDPTVIRKAQLFHEGLKNTGFVQTDSQGNEIYIVPGSTTFAETIAKLPFLHDSVPITNAITGQLSLTLPGLNRFGQPSVSPLIGIQLQQVASIFPEVQPIASSLSGGQGSKGILRALVPGHIMRIVDAVTQNDKDQAFSSAMKTAAQVLEANGHGLPDNATIGQQEEYLDRLRNHARTILVTQAIFGFLTPAPPGVIAVEGETPGSLGSGNLLGIGDAVASLRPEYLTYVRNLGVEEGTRAFLEKYPDTTPDDLINRNIAYSKGFSETEGRAPVPPTEQATEWYKTNAGWAKQYPYASAWLMPPTPDAETASEVDMQAYREQQAMGLRKDIAPTQYLENLKFAAASGPYFDQADQFDQMSASARTPQARRQVDQMKALWSQQYLAVHPWFAQQLQSGEAKQRRKQVLDEMRLAFQDPATPNAWHEQGMRDMLKVYDQYLMYKSGLAGRSDQATTRKREHAKNKMLDWGTAYVMEHPELQSFWSGIIKPEVG